MLLCEPATAEKTPVVSGGFLFNRFLTEAAPQLFRRLRGTAAETAQAAAAAYEGDPDSAEAVIIDSLYWNIPGAIPQFFALLPADLPKVLLMHLPPGLTDDSNRSTAPPLPAGLGDLHWSRVIVPSRRMYEEYRNQLNVPVVICTPGMDHVQTDRTFAADPGTAAVVSSGELKLLSVANWSRRKGIDLILDALDDLWQRGLRNWSWTSVGNTAGDTEFGYMQRARIDAAPWGSHCRVLGTQTPEQTARRREQADLFVQMSRYETFGMALAEAVVCGLPIIATRAGAAQEICDSGAAVRLVDSDAGQLAGVLAEVLQDSRNHIQTLFPAESRGGQPLFSTWAETAAGLYRDLTQATVSAAKGDGHGA